MTVAGDDRLAESAYTAAARSCVDPTPKSMCFPFVIAFLAKAWTRQMWCRSCCETKDLSEKE